MLKSSVSKWMFAGICAVCSVALVCGGMLISKNFDATPPVDKASATTVYTRGIPISNQQYWYFNGNNVQQLSVSGTAVIYVYYDNTYIDSVKAVAPDLTWYPSDGNSKNEGHPNYTWSGDMQVQLKDGYDYIKSFTGKFSWSIYTKSSNASGYGAIYLSGFFNDEAGALTRANNILSGSYTSNSSQAQVQSATFYPGNDGYYRSSSGSVGVKVASYTDATCFTVGVLKITVSASNVVSKKYNLTFDYNDGTGKTTQMQCYYSQSNTLPTPTRENYTFNGWNIDGTTYNGTTTYPFTRDMVASAQWTYNGPTVVEDDSITYSIAEGSGSVAKTVSGSSTTLLVTPTAGDVYRVEVDGVIIPIDYYKANIWNAGGACEITYYTKDEPNIFVIRFDYIMQDTNVKFYIGTRSGELKDPPLSSGGTQIDGVAVFSTEGGEARVNGFDTANTTGNVHLSAVPYTGYNFVGWEATDGTDLSAYNSLSVDIPLELIKGKVVIAKFVLVDASLTNSEVDNNGTDIL